MKKQLNVQGMVNELKQSPFFRNVVSEADTSLPKQAEGEQKSGLKNAQTFKRSNAQMNERTNERMHKHTDERSYRLIVRTSFDLYLDQIDLVEKWARKRRKKEGKHVTKGEVMREIVDDFFKRKL